MRTIMAGLAEFERDLIRERVKSGLAAAKARGVRLGRQHGQRPTDKKESQEGAQTAWRGTLLSAHRPQRRALQEHCDGDRAAERHTAVIHGRLASLPVERNQLPLWWWNAIRMRRSLLLRLVAGSGFLSLDNDH